MAITRLGGANAITGTIPTSVAPGQGKILQVTDQVMISTPQTISTDTYTDLTGATLNITPTSTSNKILLQATINGYLNSGSGTSGGFGIKFFRDSTQIFETTQKYSVYTHTGNDRTYPTYTYVDSPSSTSQITYKVQVASFANRTSIFQNSAQSTFIAMEIEG